MSCVRRARTQLLNLPYRSPSPSLSRLQDHSMPPAPAHTLLSHTNPHPCTCLCSFALPQPFLNPSSTLHFAYVCCRCSTHRVQSSCTPLGGETVHEPSFPLPPFRTVAPLSMLEEVPLHSPLARGLHTHSSSNKGSSTAPSSLPPL